MYCCTNRRTIPPSKQAWFSQALLDTSRYPSRFDSALRFDPLLQVSLQIEQLPINAVLSKFFSDVLPHSLTVDTAEFAAAVSETNRSCSGSAVRVSEFIASVYAREAEMDGLFNAQVALLQRLEQLGRGMKEMMDEKEGLEQQLQMVLMNSDVLEGWLWENEGKSKGGVDVDDAFECVDAPSKQMLECTSTDLAREDVVYSLDKAVQDGTVPFDQYLRTVRLLSRDQDVAS